VDSPTLSLRAFKFKDTVQKAFGLLGLEVRRKRSEWHDLEFLRLARIKTVLDIGANSGQFATEARQMLPDAIIHCFEPVRREYSKLIKLGAKDPRLFAYNIALGEEEKGILMEVNDFTPSSSMLHMTSAHVRAFPYTARACQEKVRVVPLDSWASKASLEPPLLIKLDVQGYEDRVIRGGIKTVKRAAVILTEVSFCELYEGQALFTDLYSTLCGLGFRCAGMIRNLCDASSRILSCDAIFVGSEMDFYRDGQ